MNALKYRTMFWCTRGNRILASDLISSRSPLDEILMSFTAYLGNTSMHA